MDINSKLRQFDYFMEIQACLQECSSKIIEINIKYTNRNLIFEFLLY